MVRQTVLKKLKQKHDYLSKGVNKRSKSLDIILKLLIWIVIFLIAMLFIFTLL